jgi:ADP-heptose:LPS heptosyltransferase
MSLKLTIPLAFGPKLEKMAIHGEAKSPTQLVNVKRLQLADQWIGVPLCFVLTLFRRLFGVFLPPMDRRVRSLLFVKMAEQGSTVLANAALRRAAELAGRENVFFFCFQENRFILDVLNVIPEENVVTFSSKGWFRMGTTLLSALRRLRRLNLDAAVDMEFFSRGSAALTFLTGAKQRVGFHPYFGAGPYRGDLMTHRLLYNPHLHTSETFLSMVEALRHDPELLPTFDWTPPAKGDSPAPFNPRPEEVSEVKQMLRATAGVDPRLILLNPNASDLLPLRRWPTERYLELTRRLLEKYPEVHVGFTGAPDEAVPVAELARRIGSPRCVALAGKTTLRQLLILYTLSEVLVTNDSGPAHFATLTPIRVVTLFGPETPKLFTARTPRNTALWAGIACSPCVNAYNNRQTPCRDNRCMQAITVDQVFAQTCAAYEQGRAGALANAVGSVVAR